MKRIILIGMLFALILMGGAYPVQANQPAQVVSEFPQGHLVAMLDMAGGRITYLATSLKTPQTLRAYYFDPYNLTFEETRTPIQEETLISDAQPVKVAIITKDVRLSLILNWADGRTQFITWDFPAPFATYRQDVFFLPVISQ